MRGARHRALAIEVCVLGAALLAILASGCGSSSTETAGERSTKTAAPPGTAVQSCSGTSTGVGRLRVSGAGCATGRQVVAGWTSKKACATRAGASRTSCSVGAYRCLGAATERGLAVSCARAGRSVSFVVIRR
jgi:hypothetical protein